MTDEQKAALGFFADSPYTYHFKIGFGKKGLAFRSTADDVRFPEIFEKPYVKMLLRQYRDAISKGLECESTDIADIGEALNAAMIGLPYPFVIDIRGKLNNTGAVAKVAYLEMSRKLETSKRPGVKASDNVHKPDVRETIQDFLDALSFAFDLAGSLQ